MKNELIKCEKFLKLNDYRECQEDGDYKTYIPLSEHNSSLDFTENEIVFIGENGDWMNIPINYYALIGALIHYKQIDINYNR